MENFYNDEMLPDNFEEIARAYSNMLKKKGFIFVKLEEEEFNLLLDEINILFLKMIACLEKLDKIFNSKKLKMAILDSQKKIYEKFGEKKRYKYICIENESMTFLSLVSIENLLIIKLMLLSVKSGELELCNSIIINIASIFAESFSFEGFKIK